MMRLAHVVVAAAALLVAAAAAKPVHAQDWIGVAQTKMSRLESELAQLGPARIDDNDFYFGATRLSSGSATAEDIGRRIGTAYWLFRRDGNDFTAAVTNMHKDRGRYDLDRKIDLADARAALLAGQRYYGAPIVAPGSSAKSGYAPLKDAQGRVIGAYMILLSSQESCDRNLAPVVFPDGARSLVSIDGSEGFGALRARIEARGCNGVSISWAEACNTESTATRFGEDGKILDPIRGGATTLLGCEPRLDDAPDRAGPIRAALFTVNHWRIDANGRLILEGPGHAIVFARGTRVESAPTGSAP